MKSLFDFIGGTETTRESRRCSWTTLKWIFPFTIIKKNHQQKTGGIMDFSKFLPAGLAAGWNRHEADG
ncbi:hypothetical protein LC048_23030 [Mesobacillus subterraneus]|uniref:hypothetical protein n=1 Tax=Mesobacillus subterraneus TaxID=285983 RepID=UPI00273E8094|nr:hypothetical protein [Mesobacillus subterraneus]WLR55135.1 hypothetical protein LC048_23030 [Mesobacillus subterraneus]